MNAKTRERLNAVNHEFYAAQADAFDASRNHAWPGWKRAIRDIFGKEAARPLRVLDVGCGNGRFANFLQEKAENAAGEPHALDYTGVDQSSELLAIAAGGHPANGSNVLSWIEVDILAGQAGFALPPGPFDLVVAFGLLHHVAGLEQRKDLLAALGERTHSGGRLVLTLWQFARTKRFDKHVIPWEQYNAQSEQPILTSELEEGDYLLSFGENSNPPRYCHHTGDSEFDQLIAATGLRLVDEFEADGRSADLNRYAVLEPTP
jgi:SAM-dependent methyltransferase